MRIIEQIEWNVKVYMVFLNGLELFVEIFKKNKNKQHNVGTLHNCYCKTLFREMLCSIRIRT